MPRAVHLDARHRQECIRSFCRFWGFCGEAMTIDPAAPRVSFAQSVYVLAWSFLFSGCSWRLGRHVAHPADGALAQRAHRPANQRRVLNKCNPAAGWVFVDVLMGLMLVGIIALDARSGGELALSRAQAPCGPARRDSHCRIGGAGLSLQAGESGGAGKCSGARTAHARRFSENAVGGSERNRRRPVSQPRPGFRAPGKLRRLEVLP